MMWDVNTKDGDDEVREADVIKDSIPLKQKCDTFINYSAMCGLDTQYLD